MTDKPIGGIPHSEGDLLPPERRMKTRKRALSGALNELESLLEFRADVNDWKAEGRLMQAYKEQAEDMLLASDTLRGKIATIREYDADELRYWLKRGAGFEHLQTANTLAELAKKTPAQLMNECVEFGGETGNKTMTVDELTAHALGERKRDPALFRVNTLLSRLAKFPLLLKWDSDKTQKFTELMDAVREFFK